MSNHQAYSHYHILNSKEVNRVYWCNTLATLGSGVATIFVPIFLLKSGRVFTDVLVFLILQQLFAAILQYPASRLFKWIHPHHIMAGASLAYGLFMFLLATYSRHHWSLGLLAFVWAINRATFWAALHYTFSLSRARKSGGKQIAGFEALNLFATSIAPAVGGVAATIFGINYSYVGAIFFFVLAALPLLSTADGPPKTDLKLPRGKLAVILPDLLANACNGVIIAAELSLWPLFIFTVVTSYAGVGILSSVIALSTISVTLYVGWHQKHKWEHHFIKRGVVAYSLTNIGRTLAQTTPQIFGLNLLGGIGRSLYVTPFMNRYYTNSDGPHRLGYITAMETAYGIGAASFLFVLLLLALLLSMKAVLIIGLASVAAFTLGLRLMR